MISYLLPPPPTFPSTLILLFGTILFLNPDSKKVITLPFLNYRKFIIQCVDLKVKSFTTLTSYNLYNLSLHLLSKKKKKFLVLPEVGQLYRYFYGHFSLLNLWFFSFLHSNSEYSSHLLLSGPSTIYRLRSSPNNPS